MGTNVMTDKDKLIEDYMNASAELHEAGVEYMTSLTDIEFGLWVLEIINGTGRDSMKFAVLREGTLERLEGLGALYD